MSKSGVPQRWRSLAPFLLVLAVLLAYLPSLRGGYLVWDDPWLIRDNAVLRDASPRALRAIWGDFSLETRLALGAEYLPLRDTELWLEARLFGLSPGALRATALASYVIAVLFVRRALHATLGSFVAAELGAWVFALHPVHVESVAWLSGRKDVLAMLFVAAAMAVHAGKSRARPWAVPALLLAAHLSKAMTVTALGLLLMQDLLARRRPELRLYAGAAAVAVTALVLHSAVGELVGMTQAPAGGSRLAQALVMGPVLLRYVGSLLWPPALSLVHDAPLVTRFGPSSVAALGLVSGWAAVGLWLWRRRGRPLWLGAWLAFFVPLLPVSQIVVPLQNQMADRYLFLSVLGAALLFGAAFDRLRAPGFVLAPLTLLALGLSSGERAWLFASSERAFADATAKTELSPVAPYQLAAALEERRDVAGALRLYQAALERSRGSDEVGRRATNNLAKLRVESGDLSGALRVLLDGRTRWPDDPKLLANLVRVLARLGRNAEAEAVFAELSRRFPGEVEKSAPAPTRAPRLAPSPLR